MYPSRIGVTIGTSYKVIRMTDCCMTDEMRSGASSYKPSYKLLFQSQAETPAAGWNPTRSEKLVRVELCLQCLVHCHNGELF